MKEEDSGIYVTYLASITRLTGATGILRFPSSVCGVVFLRLVLSTTLFPLLSRSLTRILCSFCSAHCVTGVFDWDIRSLLTRLIGSIALIVAVAVIAFIPGVPTVARFRYLVIGSLDTTGHCC